MIQSCDCAHEEQDKMYGRGRRVYNVGKSYKSCTVCGKKVNLTSNDVKDSKVKDDIKKEKK